jgi:zinc transport system ATP-binding protein
MSVTPSPLISLDHVSFAYDQQLILDDVSFAIHKGDYVGLIGPNGGGKSTLLKIMVGLLKPDRGSVQLFGQPLSQFKAWPKLGYVAQNIVRLHTNFPATVKEVVGMGLYGKKGFFKSLNETDYAKISETLAVVDMSEFEDRLIHELSGGQQQRVYIARALVSEPEILFLDEPTAGVDVQTQENFYALLRKLNQEHHLTLILVSHELELVANEADEFACVNQKLTYHGPPAEFMNSEYMKQLYGEGLKLITHHHH